ncbi:C39 family peptidase [Candidatus Uhrbacteria bacterium]|nr:C39 family peptidase [Candidatus Uhrbacteria bacterium]
MKMLLTKVILLVGLLGGGYWAYESGNVYEIGLPGDGQKPYVDVPVEAEKVEEVNEAEEPKEAVKADEEEDLQRVPAQVNLAVPFASQAPYGVWDEVHEDTCEEAAILMVDRYYKGERGTLDAEGVEKELQALVAFENKTFGFFEDTTARETAELVRLFYQYPKVELIVEPTAEDIKAHVRAGRPVVLPTAGRILANPYFSGAGPKYHMIVVKGYTEDGFIVNDPGTKRGADWLYDTDHLMRSIHDWEVPEGIENHPADIPKEKKVAIVIYDTE